MSVLLLTNPFAQPQQPQSSASPDPSPQQGQAPATAAPANAVQPSQDTKTENRASDSTTYAGESGAGGAASQSPAFTGRRAAFENRPVDAAPRSILNARAVENDPTEEQARQAAIAQMEKQTTNNLIERLSKPTVEIEDPKAAPEMPDPLPTSPFLKRAAT